MHVAFAVLFWLTILNTTSFGADFSGEVVSVLDGDTIEIMNGHHADRIRLSGIDCPEKGQAYSKKAKQAASALVFGKNLTLQTRGKLSTGGRLLTCFCQTVRTSTMNWSKPGGVGGAGSTRPEIQS